MDKPNVVLNKYAQGSQIAFAFICMTLIHYPGAIVVV